MMKNKFTIFLTLGILLSSCASSGPKYSPNEDGGLGANANQDIVAEQSIEELEKMLLKVSTIATFSYETKANIADMSINFTSYYTPFAYYEDHGDSESFGYAMTYPERYMFKYYLSEDEKEVFPSIYEYGSLGDQIEKVKDLYGSLTLANTSMLRSTMETFSAMYVGSNKFLISDTNTASIFQFMTTYGYSISQYLTGVYIEILDLEANLFRVICDLGSYGNIESLYTPLEHTKIDFVDKLARNGNLKGVDYHADVKEFFEKTITNNYVLEGIHNRGLVGSQSAAPYTIHCTNNYFYLEYNHDYAGNNYSNFGYVLIPENTPVTYEIIDEETGKATMTTQTLTYAACYGFSQKEDGTLYFDSFMGPVETENTHYIEVDILPETGETGILYIVPTEDGTGKEVYEWVKNSEGIYSYNRYSSWPNCVGDFYFNNMSATFYMSGTPLTAIGAHYFEKDLNKENSYYSTDNGIISVLANGLFGWGFQPTTTWMDYIISATLEITKSNSGEIDSANIGLDVLASFNGVFGTQNISYKIKDFGKGNMDIIENFLRSEGIGE